MANTTRQKKGPPPPKIRQQGQAPRKPANRPWGHLRCIYSLLAVALFLNLIIGGMLFLFVSLNIPEMEAVEYYRPKMTSRILDRQGKVIDTVFEENRLLVPLASMPRLLPRAFVAAEDARFFHHEGVDVWSIFRALFHNIRTGARAHGGSTITQQVTRSLLLSRKKLYSRKIKEAILAYRIDSTLSKDEILHIYLNQIFLGEGAYGVQAAALTYFGKPVEKLSLAEMALLAGLPQAPSRYSPLKNFELAKGRQKYVLNRMAEDGYITPEQARQAFGQPLALARSDRESYGGYFLQHVRKYIEEKYGSEKLATGGLIIQTTLDSGMQRQAEDAVRKGVAAACRQDGASGQGPQAGLIAVETKTGLVRAHVGGLDFGISQFDRAVQARRQPGSAIKPLVFAAALEHGFTPASVIDDAPLRLPGSKPGQFWEPKNFDNRYVGPTTLEEALIHSRNVVAVKLLREVGVGRVVKLAGQLGIRSPLARDLSLALGSAGLSLLELTSAYTAFGNQGRYAEPVFVSRVLDWDGSVLEEKKTAARPVLSRKTAEQLTGMLQGVIRRGTGQLADGLGVPAAGKTGTTDDNVDAWFIGYTEGMTVGVWVGYDQERTLGRDRTGGRVAAPIWLDFMKRIR